MEDYSTHFQGTKVTLTNWVRLNNAPLLLPRASAVQWNDFVFVLASDDTALLYHRKHNIWSMLPKSPYSYFNLTPALTLHNGQILTMSANGEVSTFNPQVCQWAVLDDMRMDTGNRPRLLVSSNNILYSVVDFKTRVQQVQQEQGLHGGGLKLGRGPLGGVLPQNFGQQQASSRHTDSTVFLYNSKSKWVKINEIGSSPLKSAAVVDGTLFVLAGQDMFKLTLPAETKVAANPKLESNTKLATAAQTVTGLFSTQAGTRSPFGINAIPPQKVPRNQPVPQQVLQSATACASPMYAGSTLHAIKDTLFSFGGRDEDNQPTSDVLRYNPDTDTWESAGYMRSCRYNVAVATVQDTTMDVIVLGGSLGSSEHIMTQQVRPPSKPVVQDLFGNYGPQLVAPPSPSPPTWDNKTSIIEKCTVN